MIVRKMEESDVDAVLDIVVAFSREYSGAPAEAVPSDVTEWLLGTEVWVADLDGEIVGAICGIVSRSPFNRDIEMIQELFWYVVPESRGSSVGGELLKAYLDHAEDRKYSVVMTLLDDTPLLEDYLIKRGFRKREINYVKWS